MKRVDIELLLPEIFRRTLSRQGDSPLLAFLDVMERLHAPSEAVIDSLDTFFDPYRAPDVFIPYLASWLDLDPLWIDSPERFTAKTLPPFPTGVGRLRALVAEAAFLSQWRGTAKGLLRFLEVATGEQGYRIDENVVDEHGSIIPFHIRVHVPMAASPYMTLIRRIVEREKPAYVTFELQVENDL
jgi:phage tail-like protein